MKTNRIIKTGIIAALALMFSVSCEDDSLPDEGSLPDLNLPDADFFVTDSNSSALIKNITNSTRRGSTSVLWTLPEGAEFTFNDQGFLTGETDDEIVVRFPAVIEDPDDPELGYLVGIEAFDDNGASSGLTFINVLVKSDPTRVLSTPSFTFTETRSNFERIFTNTSANASGGAFWSVFQDGEELDIEEILETRDFDFLNQNRFSDEVSLRFPGAGDYEVFVTGINFNGFETISESQTITILPLGIPVPSLTYSSNEDYSVQTFVNDTPDTASQTWTLPAGATFVNGSVATDSTVDVSFANSGTFDMGLEIFSNGFDDDGNPIILESEDATEIITVAIVNSLSEAGTVGVIGGDFEIPPASDIFESQQGRSDAARGYWIADGLSIRVFVPGTGGTASEEIYPAFPGAVAASEGANVGDVDWFETGNFNRVRITSSGRSGNGASWNPNDERVAVQYVEVVPGVDYKVTFFYNNDANSTEIGLLALVLDADVTTEAELSIEGNVLASELAGDRTSVFTEASFTFTNNSPDRTAVKLYFRTTDNAGDYRLDDVSITID